MCVELLYFPSFIIVILHLETNMPFRVLHWAIPLADMLGALYFTVHFS